MHQLSQIPNQFSFDTTFQKQILSLMFTDNDFMSFAHEVLKPEYFSNRVLSWFFITFRDYYLDYQTPITAEVVRNELVKATRLKQIQKAEDIKAYADCFDAIQTHLPNPEYIKDEVVNFSKCQALKSFIPDLPGLMLQNDFEKIREEINKALDVGEEMGSIGTSFFMDVRQRVKKRARRTEMQIMPTGITELDVFLGGGIKPKQLGLWMAPTNRGKSVALCHCGKRAVLVRKKVLHYTLELSEDDVAERYDASFSSVKMAELIDKDHVVVDKIEGIGKRVGNSLIIKQFPAGRATLNMILSHVKKCEKIGFHPDLIMIDYLDLLKPVFKRLNRREELSDIATDMRGAAMDLDVPIWSATQSQRGAISLETHTEEQVGEDIGKVNIADIVITINQTQAEVKNQAMRLFVAKNRNGPKYTDVTITNELARMCFYVPPSEESDAAAASAAAAAAAVAQKTTVKKPPPKRKV